MAKLKPGITGK